MIYFAIALILLFYTLREPASLELQALAEMEAATLDAVAADAQDIVQLFGAAGHRIESLGKGITLGAGVLSALRKLLASRKS